MRADGFLIALHRPVLYFAVHAASSASVGFFVMSMPGKKIETRLRDIALERRQRGVLFRSQNAQPQRHR